jgi:uncharacterized phiE125 gp8 family phage protein
MGLIQITPPAVLPISLAEAKALARLDGDDADDAMIAGYIRAATSWIEQRLNRALISQQWRLSLPHFPCGHGEVIGLPLPPLLSVDSIVYVHVAGVEQTLATSVYQVIGVGDYGEIARAHGQVWPATRWDPEAVQITFTCGYGDSWNDVPEPIRHAIAGMVRGLFDGCSDGSVEELVQPYRVVAV